MWHKKENSAQRAVGAQDKKSSDSSVSTVDHMPYEYQRGSNVSVASSAPKPAEKGHTKNYFTE